MFRKKYTYPDSNTLKNLLGIKDLPTFNEVERFITGYSISQFYGRQTKNPSPLTIDLYKAIHLYIFKDIFDWAGQFRTEEISRLNEDFTTSNFCGVALIAPKLKLLFQELEKEDFLKGLDKEGVLGRTAYYLGQLNYIHPYRDGNGRTQRVFISILLRRLGIGLDFSQVSPEQMVFASRQSVYGSDTKLKEILEQGVYLIPEDPFTDSESFQ